MPFFSTVVLIGLRYACLLSIHAPCAAAELGLRTKEVLLRKFRSERNFWLCLFAFSLWALVLRLTSLARQLVEAERLLAQAQGQARELANTAVAAAGQAAAAAADAAASARAATTSAGDAGSTGSSGGGGATKPPKTLLASPVNAEPTAPLADVIGTADVSGTGTGAAGMPGGLASRLYPAINAALGSIRSPAADYIGAPSDDDAEDAAAAAAGTERPRAPVATEQSRGGGRGSGADSLHARRRQVSGQVHTGKAQ